MPHDHGHEKQLEVKLSGNIGVFGEIKHTVNIVLPPGVQAQLDRIEANTVRIEAKIDECCAPGEAVRLIVKVGVPYEQP